MDGPLFSETNVKGKSECNCVSVFGRVSGVVNGCFVSEQAGLGWGSRV